jgi:secreted PhoX family phosphatase
MENYFDAAFERPMTRRTLIKGIAAAGAATWAGTLPTSALGAGKGQFTDFRAIASSIDDAVHVPDGYALDVVIKWGDEFADGLTFGYNCDYSAFFPLKGRADEGLMWVNHEYIVQFFTSDWTRSQNPLWNPRISPYREIMAAEKKEVGGSIVHLKRPKKGPWEVVYGSPYSRRFYADGPPVPYDGPVAGTSLVPSDGFALGTMANCSGATTPWGTVLTCEENYQSYGLKRGVPLDFSLGWIKDDGSTPEEVNFYIGEPGTNVDNQAVTDQWPFYGYVAEIDPFTGAAVKHTALGRIHHENVAIRVSNGRPVVCYTGDDAPAADGMFFKFVSSRPYRRDMSPAEGMSLLSEGQLYVAQWFPVANDATVDAGTGVWHPLDMDDPEALAFTTRWIEQNIVPANGGNLAQFRVPRAEDCELVKTNDRHVLISLTSARGRPADPQAYGIVRLLKEDQLDPHNPSFSWVDLLEGGTSSGFANPDNLAFGPSASDLWVVTDVSSSRLNVPGGGFEWHGNNAIFYVPLNGPKRNMAFRFANAPVQAELTGPTFLHEQKTLFLNVQHPGEETPNRGGAVGDPATYTSWWPEGNRTAGTGTPGKPKPSLIAIRKL